MKTQTYDLIGDIHGQHGKLLALLQHLGYRRHGGSFRHPAGRQVVFLGDYIDRGPAIRETLRTVRCMVEAGDALAILGNHEYNAVSYATPDGRGGWLRQRDERHNRQHQATLDQFREHPGEWAGWLGWMRRLPVFLDLGGLRAVHACWDAAGFTCLRGRLLADETFLRACHQKGTPEYTAFGHAVNGPELPLPDGHVFYDKENCAHHKLRVRWWDIPAQASLGSLAMPAAYDLPVQADPAQLRRLPDYPPDAPPVFFGHYWLPPERRRGPLARNVACLDYSAAHGDNALTAYRWDGEQVLDAAKFTHA